MPSGIQKQASNRYDCVYEHPWAGIASDAPATEIAPNQFLVGNEIFIKDGKICSALYAQNNLIHFSTTQGGPNYWQGNIIWYIRAIGNLLIALDAYGRSYVYNWNAQEWDLDQTLSGAPPLSLPGSSVVVIHGRFYIFDEMHGEMYIYTPMTSYVVGQTFVAGLYSMVLEGYIITCNSYMPTDSPAVRSDRYSWCAPYAYTTWDTSIDRTAGWNFLSTVQDSITGCFAMGNVGYILREEGLTQLNPTGDAVVPFVPSALWASDYGIGCTYPDTFAQYGANTAWANYNDIYAFSSGSMPTPMAGTARTAIYADINLYEGSTTTFTLLDGSITNTGVQNKNPELMYTLSITYARSDGSLLMTIFWIYNMTIGTWTRVTLDLRTQIRNILGTNINPTLFANTKGANLIGHELRSFITDTNFNRVMNSFLVAVTDQGSGIGYSFLFSLYYNEIGQDFQGLNPANVDVLLKQEEFRLGTQPTVRGALVRANGSGNLNVSISGTAIGSVTLDGSHLPKTYKFYGEVTGENPQLHITGSMNGYIIKARMLATFDEGEPL